MTAAPAHDPAELPESSVPAWVRRLPEQDRKILDRITAKARPQLKRGQWVNEGYRFFCFGETDSGKTSLMRAVLYYTLAMRWANFALIHDTKGVLPEYPRSLQFATVSAFRERGFVDGDIPVASFRGSPRHGLEVEAEEVGFLSRELAQRGEELPGDEWTTNPHALVVEELAACATDGRKKVKAPSVLWALEQGRKVGVSLIGTSQSPRNVPPDIHQQATSAAYFRLTGHDANYLEDTLDMDPAMVAALRGQNNEGLPNHQFAFYEKGRPWDGEIHCLSRGTALMFE